MDGHFGLDAGVSDKGEEILGAAEARNINKLKSLIKSGGRLLNPNDCIEAHRLFVEACLDDNKALGHGLLNATPTHHLYLLLSGRRAEEKEKEKEEEEAKSKPKPKKTVTFSLPPNPEKLIKHPRF